MSLKSCLQLLLSKFVRKSETEFISNQAMPDNWDKKIDLESKLGSFEGSFTAPSDGYFVLIGGNFIETIWINASVNSRIESPQDLTAHWICIYTPISKGMSITYGVSTSTNNSSGTTARFIPSRGSN